MERQGDPPRTAAVLAAALVDSPQDRESPVLRCATEVMRVAFHTREPLVAQTHPREFPLSRPVAAAPRLLAEQP